MYKSSSQGTETDTKGFQLDEALIAIGNPKIKSYIGKATGLFPVTTPPSEDEKKVLDSYELPCLVRATQMLNVVTQKVKVTPFAVGQSLIDRGYDLVPSVDDKGNGNLKVSNASDSVELNIVGGKVSTNGLGTLGIETIPFEPTLHRVAVVISTFYEVRGGQFTPVNLTDHVKELLAIDRVIPGLNDLRVSMATFLRRVGDKEKTLRNCSGAEFTDYMYSLVYAHRNDCKDLVAVLGRSVLCRSNGSVVPYLYKEDGKMRFRSPIVVLPRTIQGESCDAKKTTYSQAVYARDTLRSFRGGDKRERGGVPRMAYIVMELCSLYSEISYWMYDLEMIEAHKEKNFYVIARQDVAVLKEIVMALSALKFAGTLYIAGTEARMVGKLRDDKVESPCGMFEIRNTQEFLLPNVTEGLILDLRVVAKGTGKIADVIASENAAVALRYDELKTFKTRVVVRVPLCPAAAKWLCRPGIRVHNLVGYATPNESVGTSTAEMCKMWWTSICASILRSYRAFHVVPIPVLARSIPCADGKLPIHAAPLFGWNGKAGMDMYVQIDVDEFVEYHHQEERKEKEGRTETVNVPTVNTDEVEFEEVGY